MNKLQLKTEENTSWSIFIESAAPVMSGVSSGGRVWPAAVVRLRVGDLLLVAHVDVAGRGRERGREWERRSSIHCLIYFTKSFVVTSFRLTLFTTKSVKVGRLDRPHDDVTWFNEKKVFCFLFLFRWIGKNKGNKTNLVFKFLLANEIQKN